jgi:SWI/SNF-related matrix-associated actin-dependent regulator of chromatin subfamily A-like protein 1
MHIQIEANKEELFSKRVSLIKSIADCIGEVDSDLKNRLIKAIDNKDKLFTDPVLLEVLKQWEIGYKDQTNAMLVDIGKVLNKGKLNKSLGSDPSWIGVDLDGTLAEYHEYKGPVSIGKPIPKMVDRVKEWIANNKNVKIMTARANPNSSDFRASIIAIKKWCKKYIGEELPVVYEKDFHMAELWDDRAIQIKPNTGIRADGLNKSEDEGISYFHYDIDTDSYIEDYNEYLNKAQKGPFIGPRGGKWADPEHTIPWKEEVHSYSETKDRYSDEEAEQILDRIGEALYSHQAINPREKDDTGFSYVDMDRWRSVTGVNAKRQLLQKYKRQIVGAYSIEEYHKLGLADAREGKGYKADIKPYYNKTWGSLTLPVDGRVDRDTFNKFREINRKHNVWFSNGENFIKEQYLDDFDFESYKKDMGEIGINVHSIKGERKQKGSEKDEKDLTVDEALQSIKNRRIKDAIVLKKIGKDKFAFWSTYSPEFNDLFSNKTGGLSGIFYANKDNSWARETHELNLVEEALQQIKKQLPNYKLYIDEEGLKEAQNEKARYQAELQKPIPEVQKLLDSKYSLFPYQNEAVHFLDKTDGNALIGDSMGLGKTLETLAWLAKGNKKTILVVPKVVRRTWLQEADKFFPGQFKGTELVSSDIRNNRVPNLKDKNLVTVNYESLDKFYPYLKDAGFDTVVVDESHRMKNPKAKQTKAIQKVSALVNHHILLSGTAVKNKKEELFTQLEVVAPGKFTSKNQIKFATIGGLWRDMKDFYIARSKEEVLKDLPEKVTSIIQQDIPNLPDYGANKDIGDIAKIKASVAIGKVPATIDLAKEILDSSDSKIIVFTDSVEAAKKIHEELGDISLLHHGQMSDDKRESVKEEFQKTDGNGDFVSPKRVFVTTRQSMAVGATLTAADKVIFNDLPWTAADLRQAEDRAHRIGQKNNVNVYWVTASNNLFDSSVTEIIKKKYELSKKVNQGKKLTQEEIAWMNKPLTVSDILNKIHGGKTSIEEEKQLPIKEDKPDVPAIPIEVPKQEEEQKPKLIMQELVKKKRGRPPGSKNIKRVAIPPMVIQEPEKKKRGRPPGSKNKMTRVAIKEVTPPTFKREAIKEEPVKQGRGRPPKPQSVKEAESSLAYVSAKNIKLKKVASDEVHDVYQTNFSIGEDDAKIAMRNLREQGINATVLEGDPGIVKIRKGFLISESDLYKALFIGPKGGKWANAEHTIPYQEDIVRKPVKREPPGSQLAIDVQNKLKELKVDKLPQSTIPISDIRIDLTGNVDTKAIITWKDTKGKVQSGYTPKFHEMNAKKKWERINKFRSKKKEIVNTLNEKLIKEKPGSIEHQGHTILAIIAETGLRPGSTESVRKHGHYGISTLKKDHIALNNKMAVLNFIGKEGKKNVTVIQNPVTLKALEYYVSNATENGSIFNSNALDTGKTILPKGMKVKDLRTIKATESAERLLKEVDTPPPLTGDSKKDKRLLAKALLETSKKVATILNNTPSIAKASYIHPMVFEQWAKSVGASEKLWKEVG